MSVLEIVLIVLMGVGLSIYVAVSIYDLKHPEKKKERKEKRTQKKQQRKQEKNEKQGIKNDESEYF